MEEEPSKGGKTPQQGIKPGSHGSSFNIVGYNMLALAVYTIACKFSDGAGYMFDAMLLISRSRMRRFGLWTSGPKVSMWVLSALLVLAIGISTCVAIPPFIK